MGDTLDYLHNLLTRPAKCGSCINSFPVKWNKEGVASAVKGGIREGEGSIKGRQPGASSFGSHLLGPQTHGRSQITTLVCKSLDFQSHYSTFSPFPMGVQESAAKLGGCKLGTSTQRKSSGIKFLIRLYVHNTNLMEIPISLKICFKSYGIVNGDDDL